MKEYFKDLNLWVLLQENHKKIIRWNTFLNGNDNIREQNNLQHIVSFMHVVTWACFVLEDYISFNSALVLSAAAIHEHGEALLERDIVYDDKKNNASGDFLEYEAVMKEFSSAFDKKVSIKLEKAFLLQFATREDKFKSFPKKAQKTLKKN